MKRNETQLYDAHFREIYHRIIFIQLHDMEPISGSIKVIQGANGVVAYGFQEERATMTFLVLASARLEEPDDETAPVRLVPGPFAAETYLRFRFSDAEESQFLTEDKVRAALALYFEESGEPGSDGAAAADAWLAGFDGAVSTAARYLEPQDPGRLAMLDLEMIDLSRNLAYPEFVSLTLYDGRLSPEMVWARPVRIGEEGEFYGYIAHDTRQKFGLTPQDEIMFRAYDNGHGGIQLMWDGRKEETDA